MQVHLHDGKHRSNNPFPSSVRLCARACVRADRLAVSALRCRSTSLTPPSPPLPVPKKRPLLMMLQAALASPTVAQYMRIELV